MAVDTGLWTPAQNATAFINGFEQPVLRAASDAATPATYSQT